MSQQQREQERGPAGDQREDGVVVEPGAAPDRSSSSPDLERQGLEDEGDRA